MIRAEPLFKPEMVKINLTKSVATVGEMVHVEIQINSGLERVSLFVIISGNFEMADPSSVKINYCSTVLNSKLIGEFCTEWKSTLNTY